MSANSVQFSHSTHANQCAQSVQKGDFLWAFDLKSAYHQIPIFEGHCKYLGFSAKMNCKKQFFCFKILPFGLNNIARVLTKMMKYPLGRWRSQGARSYIHLENDIGTIYGVRPAQEMLDRVRIDLIYLGLQASP